MYKGGICRAIKKCEWKEKQMQASELCVLIPSLEPDERLPKYVDSLLAAGFGLVLVVNDGSGPEYDDIFARIAARARCRVLRHEVNRGKGQALRTGIAYIRDHTKLTGVITADADGQHTAPDTLKLAERLSADRRELLVGSRDFSRKNRNIPARSRFGNRATSAVFAALYGHWLPDTQTGLRAVNRACFDDLLAVTGDRFEYEMNMLIYCATHKIAFEIIPIETIYLEENKSSHFHPLRDSWRIYKLLLGSFFRYSAASVISFLLDYAVLSLLMFWVFKDSANAYTEILGIRFTFRALVAAPIARLFSAPVNFLLNKNFAFQVKESRGAVGRYIILAAACMIATTFLFGFFDTYMHSNFMHILLKIIIDVTLYVVNYRIQRKWVFQHTAS